MNLFETVHCRRHSWLFHKTDKCPHCVKEGLPGDGKNFWILSAVDFLPAKKGLPEVEQSMTRALLETIAKDN